MVSATTVLVCAVVWKADVVLVDVSPLASVVVTVTGTIMPVLVVNDGGGASSEVVV